MGLLRATPVESKFRKGQIVWATVTVDRPLVVMAVTTTYLNPAPGNFIELPWHPVARRVSTGLARRSAAVVTWLDTVYSDEVPGTIGLSR